ncbi:MAG: DUF3471 domain-containing protein, partial [Pyrinomonadaceae bacterium]|nr:DUF3471 domain-containing protein [Pyrinomonadaceae bacterium]
LGRYHGAIMGSIGLILNGQPYEGPKKSVAEAIYKTAKENGGAAAVAEYRKLKSGSTSENYDFSEGELNTLGYQIMGMNKTKDAIEIFKLNVEMFPKASNPYDSLGEAYLKDGQKDLALINYKKSVELDSNNANAIVVIRRLEGKETKVDSKHFDKYLGKYQLTPNFIITITMENEKLIAQATGQGKLDLIPESETIFSVKGVDARVIFVKGDDGSVTELILDQGGRRQPAKKIE